MTDLLIKNGLIVTMDHQRRIIKNGAVAIRENMIVAVDKTWKLEGHYKAEDEIDAKGKLVLPGFIDAHLHSDEGIMRGIADEVGLIEWIHKRVLPFEAAMRPEDVHASALLSYVEMIRSGTTCFAEAGSHPLYINEVGRAMEKMGIRGRIGLFAYDMSSPEFPIPEPFLAKSTDEIVGRNEDMFKRWNGVDGGRITGEVVVTHPTTGSGELYMRAKGLADKYDTILHTHLAIDEEEEEIIRQLFRLPPVEYLERLGVLDDNVLLVHMCHTSDHDIALLKKRGAKVCTNPSAGLHGGYGVSYGKFPEMLNAGINVALGCDGAPASNFLDMMREMYLAATLLKDFRRDTTIMPPEVALEMATINGAKALKLEKEIGSISPGKKADLIILDLGKPEWVPLFNVISNLVYSAHSESVETVIINGKIVMENRVLKTVDETQILNEAQRAAERVAERAKIDLGPKWQII